jgi:hypothetical protein
VSWLWRDELRVLLTPRRVHLQRRARGVQPVLVEQQAIDVDGGNGFDWAAAVEALATLLASRPRRAADAVLVLSNHFVRYTLVPASDLLVTHEDEVRFAQQDFARVYGPAAERWQVSVSADSPGAPLLASGVVTDLVDALRATLRAHGLRPRSLQPALMAAFNAARGALPPTATRLVCLEPGMAVSALLAPGWSRVRSQRIAAGTDLEPIVQRERALDDTPLAPESICVLPLLAEQLPAALADGTALKVLPALWTAAEPTPSEQAA